MPGIVGDPTQPYEAMWSQTSVVLLFFSPGCYFNALYESVCIIEALSFLKDRVGGLPEIIIDTACNIKLGIKICFIQLT